MLKSIEFTVLELVGELVPGTISDVNTLESFLSEEGSRIFFKLVKSGHLEF